MRPLIQIFDLELMTNEKRTKNKHYSIPGEAAVVQVQILYQRTRSGKHYLESHGKYFKMKTLYKLQTCIITHRSSLTHSGQSEVFHMTAAAGTGAKAL